MSIHDPKSWMWDEALELLEQAERMQRRYFRITEGTGRYPIWEPPADIFETPSHLWLMVALPGMTTAQLHVEIDAGALRISGQRTLPPQLRFATIHRLEIPYGQYQRLIQLPPGRFEFDQREMTNGLLILSLRKL